MMKGFALLIGKKSGSMRQRIFQKLRILVLVFVLMSLTLKFYVQTFPYSFELVDPIIPCEKEIQSEKIEKIDIPLIPINDTHDDNYSYEINKNDTDIKPAFHPLPHSDISYDFTVVTGSSKNHFCPTKSFLYYMKDILKGFKARLILYDLGFSYKQLKTFEKLQKLGYFTELRTFQWSHYPEFWNITLSKGEYAWKPGMIAEVARDYPGTLVWLDSGTRVEKSYLTMLDSLLKKRKGFVSPRSSGKMEVWTHPGVYDYYGDDHKKYDKLNNCNGASITFDTTKTQYIIDDWFKCALVKDCIAPPGSSRINHRQDQTIITYLAAKNNFLCNDSKLNLGVVTHQDGHCRKYNSKYESTHNL